MSIPGEKNIQTKPALICKFFQLIFRLLIILVVLAGLIFIPAGRLN
jgi:hypothetical protein